MSFLLRTYTHAHVGDGVEDCYVEFVKLTTRRSFSSWVRWIPRERNRIADRLANIALDRGADCAYMGHIGTNAQNCIIMSDGAYRASSRQAAAAWTILQISESDAALVLAGAQVLHECTNSMQAETCALDTAIRAMLNLSAGAVPVVPHGYSATLQQSDILSNLHHELKC